MCCFRKFDTYAFIAALKIYPTKGFDANQLWAFMNYPYIELISMTPENAYKAISKRYNAKRSTEGYSKFKSPETRQVQERLVSTLEHMQVPKWDRTRCPEE